MKRLLTGTVTNRHRCILICKQESSHSARNSRRITMNVGVIFLMVSEYVELIPVPSYTSWQSIQHTQVASSVTYSAIWRFEQIIRRRFHKTPAGDAVSPSGDAVVSHWRCIISFRDAHPPAITSTSPARDVFASPNCGICDTAETIIYFSCWYITIRETKLVTSSITFFLQTRARHRWYIYIETWSEAWNSYVSVNV
jgi:hypothetical protein